MTASAGEPVIYLDTSVVVALLTPEENSEIALHWFEGCRVPVISSDWLIPETHSALAIKQRVHGLPSESCAAAAEPFDSGRRGMPCTRPRRELKSPVTAPV